MLTESILVTPDPIVVPLEPLRVRTVIAHDVFQRVEPYHLVAARDNAPDPLRTRRSETFDLPQKLMQPYSILIRADLKPDPLVTRRVVAFSLVVKEMQPDSILTSADLVPDPLLSRLIHAHEPVQKSMLAESILVVPDRAPDPLVRKTIAFDLSQKEMKPYAYLAYADVVAAQLDPLRARMNISHDPTQRIGQTSILVYKDLAPEPLIRRTVAFDLVQKSMQPYFLVARSDAAPAVVLYPLGRRTIAHDIVHEVTPYSVLASRDRAPDPLLRLVHAHDPVQKEMQVESILATVDRAPYPLLRMVQAFDLPQKVMKPYAYKAYTDFAPPAVLDPLWRRIIAHTPEQKLMQAVAVLGLRDAPPSPLSLRVIAHDPTQKVMQVLGILVKADRAPDPLLRYVVAHSIPQKEQEPYYATPYPVLVFRLDPLVARRITAHTTEQKVGGKSILVVRDRAPDPLVSRRVSAFELTQKEMEPFSALYDVARIPEPLRTRTTIAFDYIQLVQPRSVLATRDLAPDPLLRYTVAFDPIQKIMQPIPIVIIPDNVPYPLLTRFIQAHDPIHKQTLPTSILLPVFIPEEFYILTGILIERLWQGTISRKWEGRYWKRWLR